MSSDLFTKNLPRNIFERHTEVYCGQDGYNFSKSQGESVGSGLRFDGTDDNQTVVHENKHE